MNESLLRAYIRQAVLLELRRDDKFIDSLKASLRGGDPDMHIDAPGGRRLANDWLDDLELELGHPIAPGKRGQVHKFVASRWPGVLKRFRGDHQLASKTLYNLLDTKFNQLRMGD